MKIIIADDHLVVRRGLAGLIRSSISSVEIEEAENGETFINKVLESKFDLAILDLTMPGTSGLEALEQVKLKVPDLPVLVFSSQPEKQYALKALKAGAAGYLSKDSDTDEIVKAIKTLSLGKKYITPFIADQLIQSLDRDQNSLPHEELSTREFEVMKFIGKGKSVSEIAEQMTLSITTVSTYRGRLLDKMGMTSNAQIVIYCVEHNLI